MKTKYYISSINRYSIIKLNTMYLLKLFNRGMVLKGLGQGFSPFVPYTVALQTETEKPHHWIYTDLLFYSRIIQQPFPV